MRINNGKKRKGFVTALALSLLASLSLAGPASALPKPPGPGGQQVLPAVGNIDETKLGSLTVHKYEAPQWDQGTHPADGTQLDNAPATGKIDGVTFTLQKVADIDLKKAGDWAKLKALDPATAPVEGAVQTKTTANGEAKFDGLAFGAYVLKETQAPENVSKKAKDSIVTIPFPATNENFAKSEKGWIYDVHVYPKNEITDKPSKVVADDTPTTTVGSDIKWELTVPVPKVTNDFTKFTVTDTLDGAVKHSATNTPVITLNGTALEASKYAVSGGEKGGELTFDFANALTELNANKGNDLVITFYTTVESAPTDNIVTNNKFVLTFDNGEGDKTTPPPTEDEKPKAYFGDYQIKKISSVGDKLALKDAEFAVYATRDDAAQGQNAIATVKSDDKGIVSFKNLYRGNVADAEKEYFVKETAAPAGYKPLDEVVSIIVKSTTGKQDDRTIENNPYQPNDLPDLPLTGAAGKVLLIFAGVAIVAISVGTAFVTRRRKDNI